MKLPSYVPRKLKTQCQEQLLQVPANIIYILYNWEWVFEWKGPDQKKEGALSEKDLSKEKKVHAWSKGDAKKAGEKNRAADGADSFPAKILTCSKKGTTLFENKDTNLSKVFIVKRKLGKKKILPKNATNDASEDCRKHLKTRWTGRKAKC